MFLEIWLIPDLASTSRPSRDHASNSESSTEMEGLSPRTNSEGLVEKVRQLGTLTAQADKLAKEQAIHTKRAKELEEQIKQGELACGRMLQQTLELQRAIEIRKKHIKEDRKELSDELSLREVKMEQIKSIVSSINKLTIETNAEVSIGDAQQEHHRD